LSIERLWNLEIDDAIEGQDGTEPISNPYGMAMRAILPMLVFALAFAPSARGQTYVPGRTPAARSLQQQQLWTEQQGMIQLQHQQNIIAGQPAYHARQARIQADQAQLRQQQQANLAAQMQLRQQQRAQASQATTPASPAP
jgi:hypothetical protein